MSGKNRTYSLFCLQAVCLISSLFHYFSSSLFNHFGSGLFLCSLFDYFNNSLFLSFSGLVLSFLGAAHHAHSDSSNKQYFFHDKIGLN